MMAGVIQPDYSSYFNNEMEKNVEAFLDKNLSNPSSQSGFGKITPEFINLPSGNIIQKDKATDNHLLDMDNRPINHFAHNNLVPFYGSKLTQNMRGTGVPQAGDNNAFKDSTHGGFADATPHRQRLANFTGCDEMYMHKREVGNMFSPVEGLTGWVFGTPAIRPDMDRYSTGIWNRHGETPVEKIQIGPGIGLDYNVPAEGGFHQYTRIVPNNVSDYKSNQLEGRVNAGKWHVNHPTSQIVNGVNQNRPNLVMSQARRPTMKAGFYTSAPSADSSGLTNYNISISKGKQNREDTEQSIGFGNLTQSKNEHFNGSEGGSMCVEFSDAPLGMVMKSNIPRQAQNRQAFETIRPTLRRGKFNIEKGVIEECPEDTAGSHEWGRTLGPAAQGNKGSTQRDGYYVNLTDRGDANPYVINVKGNNRWSPNLYQDSARVTTKETTEYSYSGNVKGGMRDMNRFQYTGDIMKRKQIEHFTDMDPFEQDPDFISGGMQSNGLRASTEVVGYMPNAGRQNIIPNATQDYLDSDVVSSIGYVQTNALKQITSSEYGPGTLKSSNIQIGGGTGSQMTPPSEAQLGDTIFNDKRTDFVDYRQTDPFIIENLRKNPLSIYSVGKAKDAILPEFFTYTQPQNYSSYVNEKYEPDMQTKVMGIDGSPQVNILGLAEDNPFMGLSNKPHREVHFEGRAYGGNPEADNKTVHKIYSRGWQNDNCTNKALTFSSSGYDISGQINKDKFNHSGPVSNLPWGPQKATGNPHTQQGGIWNSGVKEQNWDSYYKIPSKPIKNQYKNGLPGSLISS